jgi:RNA polymerase sigma-70 factor (ECF subfamily)
MAAWEHSLQDLVRSRGTVLVGYAYLLCGDRREAEDLVQDALVKTFSRGRAGLRPDNVEGYVRRAILSTFLDGFRRRKRWVAVRHLVSTEEAVAGHEGSVGDRMDVRAALDGLSPRERACVVLRFYEDLTVTRIADELSLSEGAVKRYLSDGVHRMEGLLGPVRQSRARADADDADDGTEIDDGDEESTILVRLVTTERRTR